MTGTYDRRAAVQMQETADRYHEGLTDDIAEYLERRGITRALAAKYKLGRCDDVHEGWLSIPYLRPPGTIWFNYRRMDGGKPKYVASGERHLFNAAALDTADTTGEVAITEGELDAIVATELFGVPAVGVPGATQWDQHGRSWRRLFEGYQRIWILADPDKAGLELAEKLLESLKQARLVKLPGDVTETYLKGLNLRDLMT